MTNQETAPHPADSNFRPRGQLRVQLLRSHASVAALGVVSVVAAVFGAFAMQTVAVRLAEVRGPSVHEAMRATAGVHRSLAALRGWVVIGDPRFKYERIKAWREDVEPALKRLNELSVNWSREEDKVRLGRLNVLLRRLKESQWWVEDVAQAPGNEPARIVFDRDADPASTRIFQAISDCIDIEKENTADGRRDLLGAMADFRGYFTRSRAELASFADKGARVSEHNFNSWLGIATRRLASLREQSTRLSVGQRSLVEVIHRELPVYEHAARRSIAARGSDIWNAARELLASDAAPKADRAVELLSGITEGESELMAIDAAFVATMNRLTIALGVLIVLGLMAGAWIVSVHHSERLAKPIAALAAATQRMAVGDLKEDLRVESDDELGGLTKAFNSMRNSLEQSHEQLKTSREQALQAARVKSEFLANMSHEIRTPMNAIMGLTDVVLKSRLDGTQRDYLQTVSGAAEQLLAIINDILDFSKIESGKLELDRIDFQPRDLVGDTLRTLALKAQEKGVELVFRVDQNVPQVVVGDSVRLRQVVTNLVSNAIRFTHEGHVRVDVTLDGETPSAEGQVRLRFAVEDTGIGIPESKLDSIFNAFEQVDGSTTRRYGGTGLGLTVSSRLIERMGGGITVASELDYGSLFQFTVTLEASDREGRKPWREATDKLAGMRVLIVDDNRTNRVILTELVERHGMLPTMASSAKDALRLYEEASADASAYELIVSDVHMPEIDGHMFCEEIRRREEGVLTPIILLTSSGDLGDADGMAALKVSSRLVKPVKEDELVEAMVRALGLADEIVEPSDGSVCTLLASEQGLSQLRILLVEDSLPNQKIAKALLSSRDSDVTLAVNGKEALDKVRSERFDVVLMDVQMPVMDGFEATACVRSSEAETGEHLPIVAMTAHALKGDRERCLEAGMDAYVSKPITEQRLWEAIHEAVRADRRVVTKDLESAHENPKPMVGPIPWDLLLCDVGGNAEVLREIVIAYEVEISEVRSQLPGAIDSGNDKAIRGLAHKLKSGLGYFKQKGAVEVASRLEQYGENNDLAKAPAEWKKLEPCLDGLLALLVERVEQEPSPPGVAMCAASEGV